MTALFVFMFKVYELINYEASGNSGNFILAIFSSRLH